MLDKVQVKSLTVQFLSQIPMMRWKIGEGFDLDGRKDFGPNATRLVRVVRV